MNTKPFLALEDVRRVAQAAEAEAQKNSWAVTIPIRDEGGHRLWLPPPAGPPPVAAHIPPGKAATPSLGRRGGGGVCLDVCGRMVCGDRGTWPAWAGG